MKAPDARRQRLRQKKRTRNSDSVADQQDVRYQLAQRLLSATQADALHEPLNALVANQIHQFSQLQAEQETLEDLKVWINCFVELQMKWVESGARLDNAAALRVWNRMDKIIRRVVSQTNRKQQIDVFHKLFPAFINTAIRTVKRNSTAPALHLLDNERYFQQHQALSPYQPPVELTHQWMPRILHSICAGVERAAANGSCRPSLVEATRRILLVTRDQNPYSFFGVLYRAPPPQSETSAASQQWVLPATPEVQAIAHLLHADFEEISDVIGRITDRDTHFGRSFTQLTTLVRRVAIGFHHVMLHLYAVAMQPHDTHPTADIVAQEIARTCDLHSSFALQSDGYGLATWMQRTQDPLLREAYHLCPEVLVYVDQWRYEHSVYEFGFAPDERSHECEVTSHTSATWQIIAYNAKKMAREWRRSRLGTDDYKELAFRELGKLEKEIKHRLSKLTDLFYKQHLAKWTLERRSYTRMRLLMELKIMENAAGIQSFSTRRRRDVPITAISNDTDVLSLFRLPTRASLRPVIDERGAYLPIEEGTILKWTDDEIDHHEQETERVYELQGAILAAQEKLTMPQLSRLEKDTCDRSRSNDSASYDLYYVAELDDFSSLRGLTASCRKLSALTRDVVAMGEEIAFHGAAAALIQRPTLRTFEPETESSTTDLEAAIRLTVSRILDFQPTDTSGDSSALMETRTIATEAVALLRCAQQQTSRG